MLLSRKADIKTNRFIPCFKCTTIGGLHNSRATASTNMQFIGTQLLRGVVLRYQSTKLSSRLIVFAMEQCCIGRLAFCGRLSLLYEKLCFFMTHKTRRAEDSNRMLYASFF